MSETGTVTTVAASENSASNAVGFIQQITEQMTTLYEEIHKDKETTKQKFATIENRMSAFETKLAATTTSVQSMELSITNAIESSVDEKFKQQAALITSLLQRQSAHDVDSNLSCQPTTKTTPGSVPKILNPYCK
jgi:cellobiose phosphorylase